MKHWFKAHWQCQCGDELSKSLQIENSGLRIVLLQVPLLDPVKHLASEIGEKSNIQFRKPFGFRYETENLYFYV